MSTCMIVRRGRSKKLQTKTVTPSTSQQTITPDSGYDGLSQVTVEAISPVKAAQTYTPGTSNKTIAAGQWLTGAQTISGDADLKAANIKKGVSIFGVTGTLNSLSNENALLIVEASSYPITVSGPNYTETQAKSDAFHDAWIPGDANYFILPINSSEPVTFTVQDGEGVVESVYASAGNISRAVFD